MAFKDGITNDYFNWLCSLICGEEDLPEQMTFNKLLMRLHKTKFKYTIRKDQNRAEDGKTLRWRFICNMGYQDNSDELLRCLGGSCSVLEMMIALAIRCEDVMDEPRIGNRTSQWFWGMVVNLGLGSMSDTRYDKQLVDETITRFLKREYEPNGKGGLFTIRNCDYDLRTVEIWLQLCWYLDSIA
jgi:hypothetical protein